MATGLRIAGTVAAAGVDLWPTVVGAARVVAMVLAGRLRPHVAVLVLPGLVGWARAFPCLGEPGAPAVGVSLSAMCSGPAVALLLCCVLAAAVGSVCGVTPAEVLSSAAVAAAACALASSSGWAPGWWIGSGSPLLLLPPSGVGLAVWSGIWAAGPAAASAEPCSSGCCPRSHSVG